MTKQAIEFVKERIAAARAGSRTIWRMSVLDGNEIIELSREKLGEIAKRLPMPQEALINEPISRPFIPSGPGIREIITGNFRRPPRGRGRPRKWHSDAERKRAERRGLRSHLQELGAAQVVASLQRTSGPVTASGSKVAEDQRAPV